MKQVLATVILLAALALSAAPAQAQAAAPGVVAPDCATVQVVTPRCRYGMVTLAWYVANHTETDLVVRIESAYGSQEVAVRSGEEVASRFSTQIGTGQPAIGAGVVRFVWFDKARPALAWQALVRYDGLSCQTTAVQVSRFVAWR